MGLALETVPALLRSRGARRLGEMLREVVRHEGGRPEKPSPGEGFFKLTDVGLSYKDSHKFQRLASIPEDAFEDHLAEARSKEDERSLTTAALLRSRGGGNRVWNRFHTLSRRAREKGSGTGS